jgi:hypothetical protein
VEAATDDVSDRHPQPPVGKLEGVVPVAAELSRGRGQVAAREPHGRELGQTRDEAALKRVGEAPLALG